MTFLEAQQALCRKLELDYTDVSNGNNDLFSLVDIKAFVQIGADLAWDFARWPFAEGSKTLTNTNPKAEYYDYPDDFVSDSVDLLMINGKEYTHRSWRSFRRELELSSTTAIKIFTTRKRFIFPNINAYSAGNAIDVYGKLKSPTLSADADLMPFSPNVDNQQYSGNDACVKLAFAEALGSEKMKNPAQATKEKNEAYQTLGILWKPFADALSMEQQNQRQMFDVPDFFENVGRRRTKRATFESAD